MLGNYSVAPAGQVAPPSRPELAQALAGTVPGPAHLCGVCGFVLEEPGQPCPRCALLSQDVAAALDARRVAESAEDWLKRQRPPHPLEVELEKLQRTLEVLESCPPLRWTDKLLWKGLRWLYRMRLRRVGKAWEELKARGK